MFVWYISGAWYLTSLSISWSWSAAKHVEVRWWFRWVLLQYQQSFPWAVAALCCLLYVSCGHLIGKSGRKILISFAFPFPEFTVAELSGIEDTVGPSGWKMAGSAVMLAEGWGVKSEGAKWSVPGWWLPGARVPGGNWFVWRGFRLVRKTVLKLLYFWYVCWIK